MATIRKGLADLPPPRRNNGFVPWIAIGVGERRIVRFLTDAHEVCRVDTHEFVTCEDGGFRSFVCRSPERCRPCERGAPQATLWVYIQAGDITANGRFKAQQVGVLKVPEWSLATPLKEAHERYGSLLGPAFEISREAKRAFTLNPIADPPTATEQDLLPELSEVIEHYASEEFHLRYLGDEPFLN